MSQTLIDHFETLAQSQGGVAKLRGLILELAVLGRLLPRESIWKPIKLGACVELISGQHLGPGEQNQKREGEPYITGPSDFGDKHPQISRWTTQAKVFASENDVLLSVKGAVGRVNILGLPKAAIGRQVMAVRSEAIDFQYLYYFLLSKSAYLKSLSIGIAIPGISREDVLNLTLELPEPLEEQCRIVTKVDELMRLCDALEQSASRREAARQQLLKALLATGEWEQVLAGLETLVQTPDDVGELRKAVLQLSFELATDASGTIQKTINDVCANITDCLHSTPKFIGSGFICVDTTCLNNHRLVKEKVRFVDEDTYKDRVRRVEPQEGDILFSREGTVGETFLVPTGMKLCLGQRMMMFRPQAYLSSRYFQFFLMSPNFLHQVADKTTGTAAQHVNIGDIKEMTIPLPSLPEQHRIVAKVDRLMALCDTLEAALGRSRQTLAAAMASAVAQAV